ncbi:prepilin-type N-terminal cleavage/methylation domain-containing protein [Rheinheimera sp. WS51]|uniref:prepilin-type N-terminal cleavage/methylation domain-containing protein n=1 Tax=Rheinheimera sp. WS51 TaxID=3425886 RepID=UPI003D8A72CA
MRKQTGFTLIEIVIVIIILGLLAATALPRFLDVTDDAEKASLDGIAGGFASAVGLVRAQWEVEGRPGQGTVKATVNYDGISVGVDGGDASRSGGYPTNNGASGNTTIANVNDAACLWVLDNILQSAPAATATPAQFQNGNFQIYARANANQCYYHQVISLRGLSSAPTGASTPGNGFIYNPASGKVNVFKN